MAYIDDDTTRLIRVQSGGGDLSEASQGAPWRPAPQSVGATHPSMNVMFVLHAIRRWWKIATPTALVFAAAAAAVIWLQFTPMYEATAWFKIDEGSPFIAYNEKLEDRSSTHVYVQTQIELLRSTLVLGPVISTPEIAAIADIAQQADKIRWLGSRIQVRSVGESELFTVSFAHPDPKAAATVVNAVLDAYFRLREDLFNKKADLVIQKLEEEKVRREREVERLRVNVKELALLATGKDPFAANTEPARNLIHPLADLQMRVVLADVELAVLQARMQAMKEMASSSGSMISQAAVERKVAEQAEVQRVKALLNAKRARLNEIKSTSVKREADPMYQRLLTEIGSDEQALAKRQAELRSQLTEDMKMVAEINQKEQINTLQLEWESRRIARDMFSASYENQLKDVKTTSGDTLQLRFKQGELDRAEAVYALISDRILKLRTEQGAPERITRLRDAEPPRAPMETMPRTLLLAALAGFCLPFGLVVAWERWIRRVADATNLEQESRLHVVGEVAQLPWGRANLRGPVSKRPGIEMHVFEESIESLRTSLMLSQNLQALRVFAVTSAVRQEGKTSVASQLAISLAKASDKLTLLIDGDMRCPTLHKIFGIPLEPGLAKALGERCPFEEAVATSWSQGLHILPAGKLSTSPHRLLGNGALRALLARIPPEYRYVIIDTPPLLSASEAFVLATAADACLLCAMRDVSRVDQIRKAYERLVAAGGKPAGLVLNGVPLREYGYRYGTYAYTKR